MAVTRRSLFVAPAIAALLITAAVPAIGAFDAAEPNPLRQRTLIRLGDIAANGQTAAIGYRQDGKPGRLFVTFSRDGGASYFKDNDKLRRFPVAGQGKLGISLDICDKTIWVGSSAHFPGDLDNDSDVLVSRRPVAGGAQGQAFVTSPSRNRVVRSVDIACVGKDFLAVAWLEKIEGTTRARLIIQDQDSLAPASFKKAFILGKAVLNGGISVAATGDGVYVAWTKGSAKDVNYQRFVIGEGVDPKITKEAAFKIGTRDAMWPQLAARGQRVVAAYTDAGKVKVRISTDGGASFGAFDKIVPEGKKAKPSKTWSIDISDDRVVVEAGRNVGGNTTPVRVQTFNLGTTWATSSFGHKGARRGALERVASNDSLLKEAWHNNGPSKDTLRSQHETP